MNDTGVDSTTDGSERDPADAVLESLGPPAYGLLVLSGPGPLSGIRSLQDARDAQLAPQAVHAPDPHEELQRKLLGELGALDI